MSSETLSVSVVEDGGGTNKLTAAVNALAAAADKLASSSDKSTASTSKGGSEARRAASGYDLLKSSVSGVTGAFSGVTGALAGIGALVSANKLIELTDAYTTMSNKLRLVTTDQTKLNGIIQDSFKIAQGSGVELTSVANTYGKVALSLKGLGKNGSEATGVVKTVTQALQLTGATSEQAKNGLLGFTQGLDAGKFQAEDLNQVIENTPGLARAIAAGFSQSGAITTGALKAMAAEGKVTAGAVIEALQRVAQPVDQLAKTSLPTVEQGFTQVKNAAIIYLGTANKSNGVTTALSRALSLLADNMNIAIPAAIALAAVIAFGAVAAAVGSIVSLGGAIAGVLVGAITLLSAAILANPILAGVLAVAVLAAIPLFQKFGGSITEVVGKLTALKPATDTAKQGTDNAKTGAEMAGAAFDVLGRRIDKVRPSLEGIPKTDYFKPLADGATRAAEAATKVQTVTGGVSRGFTEIGTSAATAGQQIQDAGAKAVPAFEPVVAPVKTLGEKLEELRNNAIQTVPAFQELKGKFDGAGASSETLKTNVQAVNVSLLDVETTGSIAATAVEEVATSTAKVAEAAGQAAPAVAETAKATEKVGDAAKKAEPALGSFGAAGKAARDFIKGFTGELDANAKAQATLTDTTMQSADALKNFSAAINRIKNENAYGEKLQTYEEFTSQLAKASEEARRRQEDLQRTLADMAGSYDVATAAITQYTLANENLASVTRRANTEYDVNNNVNAPKVDTSVSGVIGNNRSSAPTIAGSFTVGTGIGFGGVASVNSPYGELGFSDAEVYKASRVAQAAVEQSGAVGLDAYRIGIAAIKSSEFRRTAALFQATLPGYASGGSFRVGGNGGTDSQLVQFMASPNERVTVETPAQRVSNDGANSNRPGPARREQPIIVNMQFRGDEYDQFRRNQRQIGQDLALRTAKAVR